MKNKTDHTKAYVLAVDMGYGHQRAASPLRPLAYQDAVINANNYRGIPSTDRKIWKGSRESYEFISRFKNFPLIGEWTWEMYDKLQEIEPFYPKKDLSAPTIQLEYIYHFIKKKNWGKHLIDKLSAKPLPLITTFFVTAFMAEEFDYQGEIYCLATDTDVSRAWAPLKPSTSRIKYFAPNYRVEERLQQYGVRSENIFVTGFPLPESLIGAKERILKKNLRSRLANLDPKKIYTKDYHETICKQLSCPRLPDPSHPLTVMFAVGGAGAQRELGLTIVESLREKIIRNELRLILVAGIHNEVNSFFRQGIRKMSLGKYLDKGIKVIFSGDKEGYFRKFDHALATTDILWTKPSELSFYTALGLPIIISPPIGSQEKFNQAWLQTVGSGVVQENPKYTAEWLLDWLNSGWFAEAAMQGFIEASTCGVENIRKVLEHHPKEASEVKKILHY